MKLYYAPGACSMAPHIVAREAGHTFDLERVDIPNKKTADGGDYWKINPKGYVPALVLDDGQVLTEVAVICQYLGDQKPQAGLVPPIWNHGALPPDGGAELRINRSTQAERRALQPEPDGGNEEGPAGRDRASSRCSRETARRQPIHYRR